ncbi:Rieske (2Fe-2S) protein, partial [Burkholderia pseudomallei]
ENTTAPRAATNVLWRGVVAADSSGFGSKQFRTWALLHAAPFAMLENVEVRALCTLDSLY